VWTLNMIRRFFRLASVPCVGFFGVSVSSADACATAGGL
jgi:hypothetical protein